MGCCGCLLLHVILRVRALTQEMGNNDKMELLISQESVLTAKLQECLYTDMFPFLTLLLKLGQWEEGNTRIIRTTSRT